jgi:hypothetical protein
VAINKLTVNVEPVIGLRLRDEAIRRGSSPHAMLLKWLAPYLAALPPAEYEKPPKGADAGQNAQ